MPTCAAALLVRAGYVLCVCLTLAALPGPLYSQIESTDTTRIHGTSLPASLYLRPIKVYQRDQPPVAGRLADVRDDRLMVSTTNGLITIPVANILKTVVSGSGTRTWEYVLCGFAAVSYISLAILGEGLGYYPDDGGVESADGVALFPLVGAGVGYIASTVAQDDADHVFGGTGSDPTTEKARFREFLNSGESVRRWHFCVQTSEVHPAQRTHADAILRSAGYSSAVQLPDLFRETDFCILRKAQLLYQPWKWLAVGAAYMSLTENSTLDYAYSSTANFSCAVDLSLSYLPGWYLVGSCDPLWTMRYRPLEWRVGLGIGFVSRAGRIRAGAVEKMETWRWIPMREVQSFDDNSFSAFACCELNLYLMSALSLGLTAEYVYVDPVDVAPIEGISTSPLSINLNSLSWGLVLGFHF